jgi:hypothetical protein
MLIASIKRAGLARAAVAAALLAALLGLGWGFFMSDEDFDPRQWQAQKNSGARDNPRAHMVVALERKHLRAGIARAEVERLLGAPEQREKDKDVYALGASPVGVDMESYVIEYDGQDRVVRFYLRRY